jgi:arylsulfatase A-like enzyme
MRSRLLPALLLGGLCAVAWMMVVRLFVTSHAGSIPTAATPTSTGPKLCVVLVFDQMRGDYLEKWQSLFVDGGFKRLQTEGAWFADCHYPYAHTVTAAGHASLMTGCTPHEHGIIGNAWYDRRTGKTVQSITGLLGPDPLRRKVRSLGDVLVDKTKGKAKVASVSIKDRAAILMAALRGFVYWLSSEDEFVTSRHYADKSRPWVSQYNKAAKVQAYRGKAWDRLRTDIDYEPLSGPDNFKFEGTGSGQGRIFPHPTPSTSAVKNSPFGNEVLLDFAEATIEHEALGAGPVTDLLCVSFSSNDLVGHAYGPDSQEVLDITLRSDLIVRDLLDYLDAKVGKGNYVVALSADHGICPLPEAAKLQGKDAARVPAAVLGKGAEAFLQKTYTKEGDKVKWIEAASAPSIYLNRAALKKHGLDSAEVEKTLAGWLVQQPGIERAFTRTELASVKPLADPIAESVRQSFDPQRSGDVFVVLKPYYLFAGSESGKATSTDTESSDKESAVKEPAAKTKAAKTPTGTTHGSPHPYDTHVPLLVMGPGIAPGTYRDRVAPQSLVPILARILGIDPPTTATYPVPAGLFRTDVPTAESRP